MKLTQLVYLQEAGAQQLASTLSLRLLNLTCALNERPDVMGCAVMEGWTADMFNKWIKQIEKEQHVAAAKQHRWSKSFCMYLFVVQTSRPNMCLTLRIVVNS